MKSSIKKLSKIQLHLETVKALSFIHSQSDIESARMITEMKAKGQTLETIHTLACVSMQFQAKNA